MGRRAREADQDSVESQELLDPRDPRGSVACLELLVDQARRLATISSPTYTHTVTHMQTLLLM